MPETVLRTDFPLIGPLEISRAKNETGYHPSVGLDEGLRATALWYESEGYV